MTVSSIRTRIADDPHVGAGNVLTTLMSIGERVDEPLFSFDTAFDGLEAGQALSIRQLDTSARARAAALHAEGIGPRDPVAIWASSAADQILAFLALSRLGAIPAMINPNLNPEIGAKYIRNLRASALLVDESHRAALAGHDTGTRFLPDVSELGSADPDAAPEAYRFWPDDPVAITHSSGTTGMPKAVAHSHSSLFAAVRHRLTLPRAQGADRILSALPVPHAATLITLNLALASQAETLFLSRQAGPAVLDGIESWRPHGVFGFAATWADLAACDLASRRLDSVALWWNTGDCAHEAHIRRLIAVGSREVATRSGRERRPGSVFIDGLGSTEMGHSHFFITHTLETNRYGRCVGRPHTFVDCEVLDPDGEPVGPGEIGELGTKSPTLALGYWNDSVTTYRTRVRDYFLTGDLMYRDAEGYYYHMDRLVDSVDLGDGHRLYTAMSEERVLADCSDILDCTVVALRDGERVVTDVLLSLIAGADPNRDRAKEVTAALDPHVAATVRRVVVVDEGDLPLGPTGKVRKLLLRQRYLDEQAAR